MNDAPWIGMCREDWYGAQPYPDDEDDSEDEEKEEDEDDEFVQSDE